MKVERREGRLRRGKVEERPKPGVASRNLLSRFRRMQTNVGLGSSSYYLVFDRCKSQTFALSLRFFVEMLRSGVSVVEKNKFLSEKSDAVS
jgi:hypothetical protein